MEESEKIEIASKYAMKGYDFDQLHYGDDINGREGFVDDIWEYVVEFKEIGRLAFYEKYKAFNLY